MAFSCVPSSQDRTAGERSTECVERRAPHRTKEKRQCWSESLDGTQQRQESKHPQPRVSARIGRQCHKRGTDDEQGKQTGHFDR